MTLRLLLRLLVCSCLLVSDADGNHTLHLSGITTVPGPPETIIREDEKSDDTLPSRPQPQEFMTQGGVLERTKDLGRETDENPSANATFTDSVNSEPNAKEETKQEVPEPSMPHMLADDEQTRLPRSERHTWKEEEEDDPPYWEQVPLDEEEREALLLELHANEKVKREGAPQDKEARGNGDNENGLFPFRPSVPMATTVPGPSVLTAWEERDREDMLALEPHVGVKLKRDGTLEHEKEDNSSVSSVSSEFTDSNDSEHPEHTIRQMKSNDDEDEDEKHDVTFEEDLTGEKRSHKFHGHWKDHRDNDDYYRENIHVEVRIREAECYSSHTESSFIVFLVALDFSHVYLSSVLIKSEKFTFDNVTNTHSYKGNIDCVPRADAVFIRFGSEPDDPWAIDQIDVDVKFYLGSEEDDWSARKELQQALLTV
ncbi:unnamed protein product [Haemonchus placei]|uniref:CS domain-containing protein n=1 Tax=Haemonchus placei TaxID=6290 RepID=A0A0N4WAQ8_HAEPC|nr:unnamed protein product [Haemonchus placei]